MEEQSEESGVCTQFPFEHLPLEIQLHILSFLDLPRNKQDFNNLNLVSKHLQKLAWDGSLYKEFNYEVLWEPWDPLDWWPKPPFVLEKLEKVTVGLRDMWPFISDDRKIKLHAFLTEIVNQTPKLQCLELRGHEHRGVELKTNFFDFIKGNKCVEFVISGMRVEEDFYTELTSSLRQVTVLETCSCSLSENNLRIVADNCRTLRSISASFESDNTSLEYFLDKMKSTLVKLKFNFRFLNFNSDISIDTMRGIGSCVKLQKLSLSANHIPMAPLTHLKYLKELDIVESLESYHRGDRLDNLYEDLLSCFGGGFPFLEKLTLGLNQSHNVSESTFEMISRSFGKLKYLQLAYFPNITNEGLKFLKRAKGLTFLKLHYFPQITNKGVLDILMHLQSLEYLIILDCLCVTDHIKSSFENRNLICKYHNFLSLC